MEGARGIHLLKKPVKEGRNLLEFKELSALLPLNAEMLNSATGVLVHSEYTKKAVADLFPQ